MPHTFTELLEREIFEYEMTLSDAYEAGKMLKNEPKIVFRTEIYSIYEIILVLVDRQTADSKMHAYQPSYSKNSRKS